MDDLPTPRVLQLYTLPELRAELERVGAESSLPPAVLREQLARAEFQIVKLERAPLALARLLYQELVMEGGQVVTAPRLDHVGAGETDVLLCATRYQFNHLVVRLRWQPDEALNLLANRLEAALDRFAAPPPPLQLGGVHLNWAKSYIMGIINVTPNSFSGDALMRARDSEAELVERVSKYARQLAADGADILDIGGESTHPSAAPVDAETELRRVLPVVRALSQEISVPLSIDTSKAAVAEAALQAGAALVNDVTGLRGDENMARVVARMDAAVVIMDNCRLDANSPDTLAQVLDNLSSRIDKAQSAGISPNRILVDPGVGFGKTPTQNLEIINRVGELRVLGFPILLGPSRKGFISKATGVSVEEREEGTASAVSIGILRGANILRVHNVKAMSRVARMTDALLNRRPETNSQK